MTRARATSGSRPRVLVREEIAQAGVDLLREHFDVDIDGESDLLGVVDRYDAIVIRSATKMTAKVIERAERLRVIGRAGVGVDNVDIASASRRGIIVANAPESTVLSAAEHTIGLLLALSRSIPQAHAALKQGRWERSRFGGVEVADKTFGLVGFGRIGQQVARRALGLEMHVLAFDPYVAPERFRELGVERADTLDALLASADFVSLHLTLTEDTRNLIDRERIALMKDGARLINAGRGQLVDEQALAEALRSGKLAGAALDVFSQEPYSGPLLELDTIVVTPHLAASTEEAQDRAGVIVAEQVASALLHGFATNAVNVPSVPQEDMEVLGPYMPLVTKLGALAVALAGANPTRLDLTYMGEVAERDTRILTVAALNGAFQGRVDQPVNVVNAPLLARERGIEVREERRRTSPDFTSLVEVAAHTADTAVTVGGTTVGKEHRRRLVRALGYEIELELEQRMLFLVNDDRPGRIGRVGTILGDAGVNIANMAVSRNRGSDRRALMALTLDSSPGEEVLEQLRTEPGYSDVRFIVLPDV